ncbi:MAG TPA: PAS domain S-box protein [Desulfuromonadales bacterium]|nr:PAS domain S-box protein [Desulfuromonadales bacterium]
MPPKAEMFFKSESRYRMLVENSSDIIFSLDFEGYFDYVSPAWKNILGHEPSEVIGHNFREFVNPDDIPRCEDIFMAVIRTNSMQEMTYRIHHGDGSWRRHTSRVNRHRDENGVQTIFGTAHDVTERLRFEELMTQSEKMTMISGMAAGMAHEINNPLGAILQHAQNIERRVSANIPANVQAAAEVGVSLDLVHAYMEKRGIFDFIAHIRSAGIKASDIITNMLQFSRRSDAGAEPVDLSTFVDKVLELAGTDYDMKKKYNFHRIELQRHYVADLPPVLLSVTGMEQVLLNILNNAAQALAGSDLPHQPRISVRTRVAAGMAVIEIEDNGPGMDKKTAQRIFEPFFTTKEIGVGTGLGLSVAYEIVTKGHHGLIDVSSQPGMGCCFTVKLPLQGVA